MLNIIGGLVIAAFAGAFYFEQNNKLLALGCLVIAYLFAIGYFDVDKKEHEKSVK